MKLMDTKFLENNNLLALEFSEGFIFSRVLNKKNVSIHNFIMSSVPALGSNTPAELKIKNKDSLYLSQLTPPKIIHCGIGIKPYPVRLYTRYPEGSSPMGKPENLNPVTVGDDYGYIDESISSYEKPTDANELFIVPQTHLTFEAYNPDDQAYTPLLNIPAMEYKLQLFNPYPKTPVPYYRKIISKMAERSIPTAFAPVGEQNRLMDFSPLKEKWNVKPISIQEGVELWRR